MSVESQSCLGHEELGSHQKGQGCSQVLGRVKDGAVAAKHREADGDEDRKGDRMGKKEERKEEQEEEENAKENNGNWARMTEKGGGR